jgi:3-deoxy-D-manno-octulosonic acid kinase
MKERNLPVGFIERQFPTQTWWIKAGWEEIIPERLGSLQSAICNLQSAIPGGRAAVRRIVLGEQGNIVVRHYHRGGFVRYFVRDVYWDWPPRPLAELISTETARQRGISTIEVLGACTEWLSSSLYRGLLVSREAEEFVNLWEWLQGRPPGTARRTKIAAVAQAIAQLHTAGIDHADLNLTNILVRISSGTPEVLLIDFDQARVFSHPLSSRRRKSNLRRLRRSLDKFDPNGVLSAPEDLENFCQIYWGTDRP